MSESKLNWVKTDHPDGGTSHRMETPVGDYVVHEWVCPGGLLRVFSLSRGNRVESAKSVLDGKAKSEAYLREVYQKLGEMLNETETTGLGPSNPEYLAELYAEHSEESEPAVSRDVEKHYDHVHGWLVTGTAIVSGKIMLDCPACGATGTVSDMTIGEWNRAFTAPTSPYPWNDATRVVRDKP